MPRKKLNQVRFRFLEIPKEMLPPRKNEPEKLRAVDKKYKHLRIAKFTRTLVIDEKRNISIQEQKAYGNNKNDDKSHFLSFQLKANTEKHFFTDQQKISKIQKNNVQENEFDNQQFFDNENNESILPESLDFYINFSV